MASVFLFVAFLFERCNFVDCEDENDCGKDSDSGETTCIAFVNVISLVGSYFC